VPWDVRGPAIHAAIVRGDIPGAMALLERSYPNLLDRNPKYGPGRALSTPRTVRR